MHMLVVIYGAFLRGAMFLSLVLVPTSNFMNFLLVVHKRHLLRLVLRIHAVILYTPKTFHIHTHVTWLTKSGSKFIRNNVILAGVYPDFQLYYSVLSSCISYWSFPGLYLAFCHLQGTESQPGRGTWEHQSQSDLDRNGHHWSVYISANRNPNSYGMWITEYGARGVQISKFQSNFGRR